MMRGSEDGPPTLGRHFGRVDEGAAEQQGTGGVESPHIQGGGVNI